MRFHEVANRPRIVCHRVRADRRHCRRADVDVQRRRRRGRRRQRVHERQRVDRAGRRRGHLGHRRRLSIPPHRSVPVASIVARVDTLTAASTFAKAGVMVRDNLAANSATAILDVRPNGAIEFMDRPGPGASMFFIASVSVTFPVWLRLSWSGGMIGAWVSQDGDNWMLVGNGSIALGATPEAGLAVTSQSRGQLARAQFEGLGLGSDPTSGWSSTDVGAVFIRGSAVQVKDTWTIQGAGGNIW